MAQNKTARNLPAWIHAIVYGCCFIPVLRMYGSTGWAFAVIIVSHYYIDRFRLARYLVWVKNWLAPKWLNIQETYEFKPNGTFVCGGEIVHARNYPWKAAGPSGYGPNAQPWLAFWLLIIADNTLHLTINYLALRFL
jgi:hypothetical protein